MTNPFSYKFTNDEYEAWRNGEFAPPSIFARIASALGLRKGNGNG